VASEKAERRKGAQQEQAVEISGHKLLWVYSSIAFLLGVIE
jgi:hypothetical protein